MASTTTSYPPNPPPQHDPAFQPINNNFHPEPHREYPPRARVDSWHESAPGLRNLANGPAPSEPNLPPPIHARPPSHPTSRRPSLAIETVASTDIDKQPQSAQPYLGTEKQPSPHAPAATGPPPMQHRPTTVPPMVTAKREQNLQHLPPQTAPASPSAPLHYSHHHPQSLQPSQQPHPHGPPPTSHPQGAFAPLQPFPPTGPPPGPPPQMIAPGPPAVQPQTYHHHSAPPHMTPYPGPPNNRRLSAATGIPEADEMSPMTGTFPYHMATGTTFPARRKAVRAAQACDACRTRKAKCDEGRPACAFCRDNNTPCVYREVPPPKQDRTMILIQERVSNIESLIMKQQTDGTVVNLLRRILGAVSSKTEEDAQGRDPSVTHSPEGAEAQDPALLQLQGDRVVPQTATYPMPIPAPPSQVQTPTHAPANFAVPAATTGISAPADDPKEDDNFITIPHKHNTAAHKLLRWKSIRDLLDKRYPDNYVMDEEIRRGSLKVRGRGEGDPALDMDIQDDGPDEVQNGEFYPGLNGVPLIKGAGGRIGRGQRETLRLDLETCTSLLRSFLDNIYILHPFLNDEPLSQMVEIFSRTHGGVVESLPEDPSLVPIQSISPENSFASIASSAMMDRSQYPGINQFQHPSYVAPPPPPPQQTKAGSKRKRDSQVQPGPPPFTQGEPRTFYRQAAPQTYTPQRIPATLQSAIVLLVLALGAIANHKAPVPGPLPPNPPPPQANINYGLPDQFQQPPPPNQQPQGYQSVDTGLQNIDVIPGLAYCEKALHILALHQGRSEVEYVQASLLAGLYWGQLGRPMDSWKWISAACMACQIMINQRLPREGQNDMLRDTMVRTFWSCVQLESDLLAELDVPRSGITRLEGSENLRMTYGNKVDNNLQMWLYFMAQYHIRKILNQVHSELYKVSSANSLKTAGLLMEDLEAWRRTLPPPLQWKDSDPPAEDINAARLRAKYYGAKYVINRPFVEHFIHNRTSNTNPALIAPGAMTSPAMSLSSLSQSSPPTSAHTPIGLDNRRGSTVTDEIREKFLDPCRTCLEAAVKSTYAFHGFDATENRPILTNIFGTAHAQFGNLLVLQAAYKHPKLREFVNRATLGDLLDKTIRFLHTLAPISPSLALDAQILEDASSKLDFIPHV
ncbi:hypothetical protein TWF225_004694 [Orbilia oligospora]|uniref:Uncharacterized protein n=2 Tax=Orbilia oligospora TaxID=2813651 RepID=A0A7C8PQ71_ORBOL|nr:hypothetical protein TWF751_006981 [Orbilia oligospora]KAF3186649.1 hypothetical protein TWF225_004694 [Orbilia oligospora]KAF3246326.1 hypothetical protein TWF217_009997 [Orbilia oligospora]KAF3256989.1 hypothetical protein TWF128_005134 [Orbilia oligospora]KAF3256990.1 hypothetical protein TWF128_005134 [Orbilia oligospora]